jgi:hypothetical protein
MIALHWLTDSVRVRIRITLRLAIYRQSVHLDTKPLQTHGQIFFFRLNTCGRSHCVTSSLTRGWAYRIQLLLVLASAFVLRSESRRTHDHILLSQIRYFPNLEDQVFVFIFPRNRVAQPYPQALGSLSVAFYDSQGYGGGSLFDPASTPWRVNLLCLDA